ncbi:MAG: hypothetical protein ACUZ8H_10975 [Candidatus Anammoxibacter sp.]
MCIRKDLIQWENDKIALCYSSSPEVIICTETAKKTEVNHGWFIFLKKEWIAYNVPGAMIKMINEINFN